MFFCSYPQFCKLSSPLPSWFLLIHDYFLLLMLSRFYVFNVYENDTLCSAWSMQNKFEFMLKQGGNLIFWKIIWRQFWEFMNLLLRLEKKIWSCVFRMGNRLRRHLTWEHIEVPNELLQPLVWNLKLNNSRTLRSLLKSTFIRPTLIEFVHFIVNSSINFSS